MTLEVRPFADEFVDAAAELLSANCATRSAGESVPAVDLADVTVARKAIVGSQGTGPAVVAVRDGEVVGFLMSTLAGSPGSRQADMSEAQHAAERSAPREVYRALYTALSGKLVADGCFTHAIAVPIADTDAVSTWFELGFGVDQIKGVRSVASGDLTVRRDGVVRAAESGDIDSLVALSVELQEFHAAPPIFKSALIDVEATRHSFERAIADERCCVWIAEHGGQVVGMMQVEPAARYRTVATIGIAVATEARVRRESVPRSWSTFWTGRASRDTNTAPSAGRPRIRSATRSGAVEAFGPLVTSSLVRSIIGTSSTVDEFPMPRGPVSRLLHMSDDVIERFLRSLVEHDWPALEACLADDFTRVGPYGDTYSSKADYVAFLSALMPTLAGYEMQVTRVSYADGVGFAELAETVEVDGELLRTPSV